MHEDHGQNERPCIKLGEAVQQPLHAARHLTNSSAVFCIAVEGHQELRLELGRDGVAGDAPHGGAARGWKRLDLLSHYC